MGHAEETLDFFLGVAPFLLTDEHDFMTPEASEAAADGAVVAVVTIAVQFTEVQAHQVDIVAKLRSLRVASDLHGLPGAELVIGLAQGRGVGVAKLAKLPGVVDAL